MKIGITERGDAGLNLSWKDKLSAVDGAILITKNVTDQFIKQVMEVTGTGYPLIIHATCTGWGGTEIEPNVPDYGHQLNQLKKLVRSGFPLERCVLRIDPVFPTKRGLDRVCEVLNYAFDIHILPQARVRISVLDEYPHVKERFRKMGMRPLYGDKFYPSRQMLMAVTQILSRYDIQFHTCAEPYLTDNTGLFVQSGCISNIDLRLMGLPEIQSGTNPQNRKGCNCLSCKTELLENKHPCEHGCKYCYWKD